MKVCILYGGNGEIKYLNDVADGNPGVGGSEYLLLQLHYYLNMYGQTISYLLSTDRTLEGERVLHIANDIEAIKKAEDLQASILVFIPKNRKKVFYNCLDKSDLKGIAWVHNFITYHVQRDLEQSKSVRRVVFVGRQHYEYYIDSCLIEKSTYIYNLVTEKEYTFIDAREKENIVTYVGALIPTKGFHRLAKVWKRIVKAVPTAQLIVIGSGNLYNGQKQGLKDGIAFTKYEQRCMNYFMNAKHEMMPSVQFMGKMGKEKDRIIEKTKVGVTNPTGKSETFCLSAVEFKKQGVPVVSYKGYGLLDTVRNRKDGILVKSKWKLAKSIVFLLKDNEKNNTLGLNGMKTGSEEFNAKKIIQKWDSIFMNIEDEVSAQLPTKYISYDFKWLRLINYYLKKVFHGNWESVAYMESFCKEFLKKLIKKK